MKKTRAAKLRRWSSGISPTYNVTSAYTERAVCPAKRRPKATAKFKRRLPPARRYAFTERQRGAAAMAGVRRWRRCPRVRLPAGTTTAISTAGMIK